MFIAGSLQIGFGQSSSYKIINGQFSWQEAKADAESRGGHLATITSIEEDRIIGELIHTSVGDTFYWLGGTDEEEEGKWSWITGEPWVYTNWLSQEPDNARGDEDYLLINGYDGKYAWGDTDVPDMQRFMTGYILELQVDLDRGLVAYYPFNGNANDESGNGNDGEVNGATLVKDRYGNSGKAYSFDGVDDNIEVPETEGFESNAHTISGWIYATSFRSEIFGKDGEDSGSRQWFIETASDGRITTIVWHAGGDTRNTSGSKIELNKWVNVMTTWDGSTHSLFINGKLENKELANGELANGDQPFRIGGGAPSGFEGYFKGKIDDVRFYNRALSESEVVALHELESRPASTYQFVDGNFTWEEAKADAQSKGGDLAVITSQIENDFLKKYVLPKKDGFAWLGGYSENNQYYWITGESFQHSEINPGWDGGGDYLCIFGGVDGGNLRRGKWALEKANYGAVYGYILEIPRVNLQSGLVAYYPFNGNANDESGNGNHLDDPSFDYDRFMISNSSASFENDQIITQKSVFDENTKEFTINLWAFVRSNETRLLQKNLIDGEQNITLRLYNGNLEFYLTQDSYNSGDFLAIDDSFLPFNEWTNITCTYKNQKIAIYINGVLRGTRENQNQILSWTDQDHFSYGLSYHGLIDDIRLYKRALSELEIFALYNLDSIPTPPSFNPEENLVAYYPFNGNASDESGNGHDGTVNGATLTQDRFGKSNMAYNFDGDDSILLGDGLKEFAPTSYQGLTFSFWSKADSAGYVITQYINMNAGQSNFFTSIRPDLGAGGFHLAGNGTSSITDVAQGESNDWNHWVIEMFPGENNIKVSRNGTLESRGTLNLNGSTSSTSFLIGGLLNGVNLNGQIDDIRIYDRSFSDSEIAELYELESKPPFDPDKGLIAYYPFNGNAKDASGNGNDGEVNGATLSDDRFGLRNSAYEFEQSNFVDVPASESLNKDGPHFISLWVKMDNYPSDGSTHSILTKGTNKGGAQIIVSDWGGHPQVVTIRTLNNAKTLFTEGISILPESNYFQLAYSYDGNKFTTYLNGKVINVNTSPDGAIALPAGGLRFGRSTLPPGSGNVGLNGSIDDIRIYDRSFSEEEVAALYELESTPPLGLPPVIFDHPIGIDLRRDESVVLSVGHTGTPSFEYQWYRGSIKLLGQTQSSLFLEEVNPSDSGDYTVSISNLWGTSVSNAAKIIVIGPPSILADPASILAGVGSNLLLSVQADGTAPLSYQWYKNGNSIAGANKASYFSGDINSDDIGSYTVVVSNDFGRVESNVSEVTVGTGVRVAVDSEGLATIYLRTETDGFWIVEASSDLKEWTEVNAIKTNNGVAETTDILSLINENRFYRARLLE